MDKEMLFGIIGAAGTMFTIGYIIYRGFRYHDRKIVSHETLFEKQSEFNEATNRKIEEVEEQFDKRISKLSNKIDTWMEKDDRHHTDIRSQISIALQGIAKIEGYILGTDSKEKSL